MTPWRFLFFSLLAHLLVWLILAKTPPADFFKSNTPVEITVIEKPSSTPKQIVHVPPGPQNKINLDALKPRFFGPTDQRVAKETRAPHLGYIQDAGKAAIKGNGNSSQQSSPTHSLSESQAMGQRKLVELGQTLFTQSASDANDINVEEGAVTALNTERFIYYSFFSRIEHQVVGPWTSNLRAYENRWTLTEQNQLSSHSWITLVEFLLDSKGHYITHQILQSSGNSTIDQAAVDAFKQAAFFPNPPTGMIKEDGKVHLHFSFRYDVGNVPSWARRSSR